MLFHLWLVQAAADPSTAQGLFLAMTALAIPYVVSTWLWPAIQKAATAIKGLPSIVQMLMITAANWGLAWLAGVAGAALPGVEGFGAMDLQALLTAGVGFLSTLVFKTGKAAAA